MSAKHNPKKEFRRVLKKREKLREERCLDEVSEGKVRRPLEANMQSTL